eukprot:Opistho-2@72599
MFGRNKNKELPLTHSRHHHKPFESELDRVQTKNIGVARTRMSTAAEALDRWRHGQLPSNNSLRMAIDKTQDILQTTARKQHIGGEGQRFVDDLDQLMQDVRDLITEKNADEHMQKMALHAIGLSNDIAEASRRAALDGHHAGFVRGVSNEKISRAISDGVVLVNKLIRDDAFRTALQDFISVLKSVQLAAEPTPAETAAATAAAAAVRVRVTKGEYANKVDAEPANRYNKQTVSVHLGWVENAVDRLGKHEEGNEDKEDAIHKARQHFHASISVGKGARGLGLCNDCGIEKLNKHKAKINAQKDKNLARIRRLENGPHDRTERCHWCCVGRRRKRVQGKASSRGIANECPRAGGGAVAL